jgi:hypothetical protein
MCKVEERLASPLCAACGQPTVLAMSVPGAVGGSGGRPAPDWGGSCAPGGCCGGGACAPNLN